MKKSRFFPFWMLPASWGLKGTVREEAEANYYLDGEDLERKLAEIHHEGDELEKRNLDLDLKYKRIDPYHYDLKVARRNAGDNEVEQKVAKLSVDYKHGKITQFQFEKEEATLREKPWVRVVSDGFTEDGLDGRPSFSLELDWNEHWIQYLQYHGYGGTSDEEIVERWFQDTIGSYRRDDHFGLD